MRKGRFSEEQIIAILRTQELGRPTAEVCREHGISGATRALTYDNAGNIATDSRTLFAPGGRLSVRESPGRKGSWRAV